MKDERIIQLSHFLLEVLLISSKSSSLQSSLKAACVFQISMKLINMSNMYSMQNFYDIQYFNLDKSTLKYNTPKICDFIQKELSDKICKNLIEKYKKDKYNQINEFIELLIK
jgi:hypothetical protein